MITIYTPINYKKSIQATTTKHEKQSYIVNKKDNATTSLITRPKGMNLKQVKVFGS